MKTTTTTSSGMNIMDELNETIDKGLDFGLDSISHKLVCKLTYLKEITVKILNGEKGKMYVDENTTVSDIRKGIVVFLKRNDFDLHNTRINIVKVCNGGGIIFGGNIDKTMQLENFKRVYLGGNELVYRYFDDNDSVYVTLVL